MPATWHKYVQLHCYYSLYIDQTLLYTSVKNISTGPVLIWSNITTVLHVVFQDIGIDKSKANSKQYEGNCADKNCSNY